MCYLFAALGALDTARHGARREGMVRQLFGMQGVLGHDFVSQHDARETIGLLVHRGGGPPLFYFTTGGLRFPSRG
jgi:hypothetical protein